MLQKLNTFIKRIYKKIIKMICKISFSKKCKKIDEYKKLKKEEKIKKNDINRKKYNIQLNLKFKKQNYINLFIFIIIFILIIILIIVKGTYFKIKNINIISPDGSSNTYILEKKVNYLINKLIFSVKKEELINIIKNTQQNIKNIEINKIYPDLIKIKVYSYPIIFKSNINGKNFLITNNGVLIPTKTSKTKNTELIIKNLKLEKYPDYKIILNKKNLNKILDLQNKLIKNITNLKINKTIYYKTEKEVHFIINNNTRLIFDLYGNLQDQLKQLFVFNREKKMITKPGIIYIDNRIKNKLLYCPTEEIQKCIKNINFIYGDKLNVKDFFIKK